MLVIQMKGNAGKSATNKATRKATGVQMQNASFDQQPWSNSPHAGLLQRKCACGGSSTGECEACKRKRLQTKLTIGSSNDHMEREADRVAEHVMAKPASQTVTSAPLSIQRFAGQANGNAGTAPASVDRALAGPGRPMGHALQQDMSQRFGYDFSAVRVHTGAAAALSARDVNAHAYTVGSNIVFGAGRFSPESNEGRKLIAHELTHVVQQKAATANVLARQVNYEPVPKTDPVRQQRLSDLIGRILQQTATSESLRAQLDVLPAMSSSERNRLERGLSNSRSTLITLLEERIGLLQQEITSLNAAIGRKVWSSPDTDALGNELNARENELFQHQRQLAPLKRWQIRNQIQSVEARIAEINQELTTAPDVSLAPQLQVSDPNDPRILRLLQQREELERRRRALAASLTTTATRYRQSDPRWGSRRYGTSPECTNIAYAGCGPTSLAILLNYLFREDPEVAAGGDLEIVRPPETANYAATNGRVCNDGTVGDTMVTRVGTGWPGFRGMRLSLDQAVQQLRSGNLVIFLCISCAGTKAAGGTYTYPGHFMVLNGVNATATEFGVIDPAGANIVSISRAELMRHTGGLWTVVRK